MPDRRLLLSARELARRQPGKREAEGGDCQSFKHHLPLGLGFRAEETISAAALQWLLPAWVRSAERNLSA
jgi:hypothetical protein